MVQKLEAIKGGGGSIKLGTTGKISFLMSRELESMRPAPRMSVLLSNKVPMVSSLVPPNATSVKRPKPRTVVDEASGSRNSGSITNKKPEMVWKTKQRNPKTHQIPMLNSENITLDGTPIRQKPHKKGPSMVEIMDVGCGNPERTWASPIASRLRKLGFSKLSESIM